MQTSSSPPTTGRRNFFWISLILDCWLFARLSRERALRPRVLTQRRELELVTQKREHRVDIDESLDSEAHLALGEALDLARKFNHQTIEPLHLFATIFRQPTIQGIASRIDIDPKRLSSATQAALATVPGNATTLPLPTEDFYALLMRAYRHAQDARKHAIDVIDLFTATIDHENRSQEVMEELGVKPQTIENVVAWFNQSRAFYQELVEIRRTAGWRPRGDINRAMTARATPILNRFGVDLTRAAQLGQLFPPIARDAELEDLLTTVGSTSKNILLVGHIGTGKSSLIHGIAYRMVGEDVPEKLKDKRLMSISAGHLATAGNPAAAFQTLLDEVLASGNIVLVIENLHDFTMSQSTAGSDLAEILTETVERTGLTVFATSTPAEHHRFLESHLVSSVFQKVDVLEPDENKTIQMLESHIATFEGRYPVFFTYDAIAACAQLSHRYLHDAQNPKKAVDLAEQVAVSVQPEGKGRVRLTPEHVAAVLEKTTHAKVGEVGRDERSILLNLEDRIHSRMIDQEAAVSAVSNALRRARMELRETKRPVSVFLFLGPTGVGKTELARTLAETYYGSENTMIRLDMSEYQEVTAIERLTGMTGSEVRGGSLTEPIRKNPFSLLLLDEIEKANKDVLNLFLQIFEDGRLTDNAGEVIDFTNTIIIATSNAGAQYIQDALRANVPLEEMKTQLLEQELKGHYAPEFLNRFDDIIVFQPLSEEHIRQIAKLMIGRVQKQMEAKGIAFEVTDAAIAELAKEGYDPEFG
ncbi:MAG: ATP-dependent Clp protease ATP-binding subunit, partial [bacterium]|nr:ATP-dependent Clp protease ATP-binding subunit [bacterium]